eukprot:1186783-Prorocentrum_minimum.AAC.4
MRTHNCASRASRSPQPQIVPSTTSRPHSLLWNPADFFCLEETGVRRGVGMDFCAFNNLCLFARGANSLVRSTHVNPVIPVCESQSQIQYPSRWRLRSL